MVYRLYVEKKIGFDNDAKSMLSDLRNILQIKGVTFDHGAHISC